MQSHGGGCIIPFSIAFESELKAATDAGQRSEYLQGVLPATSSIPKMIRQVMECCCGDVFLTCLRLAYAYIYILPTILQGYQDLELRYFFTAGVTEVRCWTFLAGTIWKLEHVADIN